VLQLELHAGQVELAPHRHRDAAQVAGEVGLEVEAAAGLGSAQEIGGVASPISALQALQVTRR
jgi:hypothetical protein